MLEIKSLRETLGRTYTKPDPIKISEFEKELTGKPRDYLHGRGLTDETISYFNLGYCKANNSISIPIFKWGKLISIKYRLLNSKIRYIREPDTETWLFNDNGIVEAQKTGRVLIVEGEFDAMMAWQAGIVNVISPASGKDSYGMWIELLDNIPKVYLAYDNDEGGQKTAKVLSAQIGTDKCFDVKYTDVKDANEFLLSHTPEDLKELLNKSKLFATYEYTGLGDIIESLRNSKDDALRIPFIPKVEIEKDWLVIISGRTGAGKTSYVLNIASWLGQKNLPTLIMPFERGIDSVGKRFLQVRFNKTIQEFRNSTQEEWEEMISQTIDAPIYFSLPKDTDIISTIGRASRLFGTRVVIIDHLDYIVRSSRGSKEAEISKTLQNLKRCAEENKVILLIVTHVRKIDDAGSLIKKRAGIEDLKGSSSVYQDPECVVMLNGEDDVLHVEIVKNKGEMTSQDFNFNSVTGVLEDAWGEFADL